MRKQQVGMPREVVRRSGIVASARAPRLHRESGKAMQGVGTVRLAFRAS